jgi:hypothetical protein
MQGTKTRARMEMGRNGEALLDDALAGPAQPFRKRRSPLLFPKPDHQTRTGNGPDPQRLRAQDLRLLQHPTRIFAPHRHQDPTRSFTEQFMLQDQRQLRRWCPLKNNAGGASAGSVVHRRVQPIDRGDQNTPFPAPSCAPDHAFQDQPGECCAEDRLGFDGIPRGRAGQYENRIPLCLKPDGGTDRPVLCPPDQAGFNRRIRQGPRRATARRSKRQKTPQLRQWILCAGLVRWGSCFVHGRHSLKIPSSGLKQLGIRKLGTLP